MCSVRDAETNSGIFNRSTVPVRARVEVVCKVIEELFASEIKLKLGTERYVDGILCTDMTAENTQSPTYQGRLSERIKIITP